jgi:pimeloyl-ACP methyl ester carboxylesterase
LQRTVTAYLKASSDDEIDPAGMRADMGRVRADTAALPEPARTYMQWVNDGRTAALGETLLPFVDELSNDPALSPERSPPTQAPVFLLHGADDNVIPSTETPAAAAYLAAHGNDHVRWLLTPYLTHATVVDRHEGIADGWRLVSFWTAMLDAAR